MEKHSNQWLLACQLDTIPEGKCKGFDINGHKLFAVNFQGKIFFYRNICPHLGIPLEWVDNQFLDSSGTMIQCANHGALFVMESGQCVAGPCAGRKLQTVAHKIDNNGLYVSLHELNRPQP